MSDRKSSGALGMRLWMGALGTALVAAIVYAFTMAGYVFPGESANLFTQWAGMSALSRPLHPLWGALMRMLGGCSFPSSMALRMNLFSLLCGIASAGLVCLLVGFFVQRTVDEEETVKKVSGASLFAGLVAGFVFVLSPAVWNTSTHLDYHIFDVLMALVLFAFFVPMARRPKSIPWLAALLGVGVAAGFVESPIFGPLMPVFLLCIFVTAVKAGNRPYVPAVLFVAMFIVFYFVFAHWAAASYLELPESAAGDARTAGDVMQKCLLAHLREMRLWLRRPGWIYVVLFTVLPFTACMFAAQRGLNNERTWSQYLFHTAMTLCTLLAVATPLSPATLMRKFNLEPVATSTLAAVVAGYLAAYWYLLARTEPALREGDELTSEARAGGRMAPIVLGSFLALVALASLVTSLGMKRDRGAYADICAGEIVDRLGERKWLVTDGMLDTHLRIVAASRGKELNIISLHRDMDSVYLRQLSALIKEKKLTGGKTDLSLSVEFGVLPFIQDWFAGDPDITKKVAVFGVPDLWYMASARPLSECFFFGGVKDYKEVDGNKAAADFKEFWKKIEPELPIDKGRGSRSVWRKRDPVDILRIQLRRHIGFIGNNLGVTLQDMKMDNEAYEIYELVLKSIDPDNISSLFNEFEMARAEIPCAVGRRKEIAKQLQAIVEDTRRRYALWSLARYYGYIRSAEIFARMGYAWAHSALPGNAIANVKRAQDLIPPDRQGELLNVLAQSYASDNDTQKSRELYMKVLEGDADNHSAYMGLMRLALQKGDYAEAMKHLEKAVNTAKSSETAGFDWALLHMMNNDLGKARLSLQKVTDLQPKSLQAWALLAGVLLQQYDQAKTPDEKKKAMDEIETVILPKMQSLAGTPRDYFLQMTRALVFMRKGEKFRKDARDAFVVASAARPDISAVSDMILNLDIQMVDAENAEKHARQVLRKNRKNKLANYVMGSIRLQRGDLATAETFLRISVADEKPLASAQNDLAETLRRLKKYGDAEEMARAAVKNDPKLYVAWETLASILLDQNKNVAEAEDCVKKAIELVKEISKDGDLRMFITLARAQLAKGDTVHFNETVRKLNSRRKELSQHDRQELEELQKQARAGRK